MKYMYPNIRKCCVAKKIAVTMQKVREVSWSSGKIRPGILQKAAGSNPKEACK